MDLCGPIIEMYTMAFAGLLIVLGSLFLVIVALILRCVKLQGRLDLQKPGARLADTENSW